MAKCKNCKNFEMAITSDNEYVCNWCEKIKDNPYEEMERECEYYEAMSNADRIRSMTDEELEEYLWKMAEESPCYICAFRNGWLCEKPYDVSCHGGISKWLKSEVGCG